MLDNIKPAQQSIRDEALVYYDAVKSGDYHDAGAWLEQTAVYLQKELPLQNYAYYLWVLGEYVHQSGENALLEEQKNLISRMVDSISRNWREPAAHWLNEGEPGWYLSHIAICYAGLRSISYVVRSDTAQRACKEIREEAFASFMRGTHFVSRKHPDEVGGDIAAAAVPFGLITPGDLALLKAIDQLDERGLSARTAALMALYNLEIGKGARAWECYNLALEQGSKEDLDRGHGLIALARCQLERGWLGVSGVEEGGSSEHNQVRYTHSPLGNESPYIVGYNERSPRLVTAGQPVTIRTFAESQLPLRSMELEYAMEDGETETVSMNSAESPEGDVNWEGQLPPFSKVADQVRYRFVGRLDGESQVSPSSWYSFPVLQWLDVDRVASLVEEEEGKLCIRLHNPLLSDSSMKGERETGTNDESRILPQPRLILADDGRGAIRFELSFLTTIEQQAEQVRSQQGIDIVTDGSYKVGHVALEVKNGILQINSYGCKDLNDKEELRKQEKINPQPVSEPYASKPLLNPLLQVLVDSRGTVYKTVLNLGLSEEDRLYGMGERFARLEYRGFELDNYVYNQYKDQGFRTYIPVPFVLSTAGYGLFLQSSLYSVFRFGTVRPDLLQLEADISAAEQVLTWHLFSGRPLDIIRQFTEWTGKPKLPPKWAFGPWMSSNNWDSQQEVGRQLELAERYEIPSTVMVLEQWSDEATFYIFNDAQYDGKPGEERFRYDDFTFPEWGRWPNPKQMVQQIHDNGMKILLWQAPVMKFMEGLSHPQRDRDEKIMIERSYGVRDPVGRPYRIPEYEWFRGSMVPDFTNPEAADWWFAKRQYLLDEIGIDGFKTDGGECIYGSEAQFADGRNGSEMRNEYPNVYIGAFHKFANEHVEGGAITFSRSGYTGAQTMPLHWAGDEKSTFDAFRSSIIAGLSSGISGLPFWGWDLGGFSGEIPSAELFIRSAQMAAFCPVMQYHAESKGEFNMDRTPWNIAERRQQPQALDLYKTYADLRMNLLPYLYDQAIRSSESGHPLMRAMMLAYPDDLRCRELSLQYLFGDHLLVAPVTEEGAREAEVYFPEGSWLSLFDVHSQEGGQTAVIPAELGQIPVYLRSNGVVALHLRDDLKLAGHVGNRLDGYERLCLMVYLTDSIKEGTVFQDDLGTSVKMKASRNGNVSELALTVQGEYPVTLMLRALGQASSVRVGGQALRKADHVTQLASDCYTERGDELHIVVQPGSWSISIEAL